MTKEEIKQRFFDIIGERLEDYKPSPEAVKDLAKAFKAVCEIDDNDNDNFLKQLAEMPKASKAVTIQPLLQVDDDGGFGLCD